MKDIITINIKEYDEKVKDLMEELEKKYAEGRENANKEDESVDESLEVLARMSFTLQNIMVFAELRKKLFKE